MATVLSEFITYQCAKDRLYRFYIDYIARQFDVAMTVEHEKRPQEQSADSTGGESESKKGPKHRKGGDGCVIKLDKNDNKDSGKEAKGNSIEEEERRSQSDVPAPSVEDEQVVRRLSDPEISYAFGVSKYVLLYINI